MLMEDHELIVALKFLQWQPLYSVEKPFQIFMNIPSTAADRRDTNLVFEDAQISIQDVRTLPLPASIDEKGFIYRKHRTYVESFNDRKAVEEIYLPEVEILLRNELEGVDRVFFFDWRVSCFNFICCMTASVATNMV